MSYMHNAPWTSAEKVDLLVNVLRGTVPDLPFFLMQVLHEKGIYPKWSDMPLPAGRSLSSSQIIYEEMGRPFKQQATYNVQPAGVAHAPALAPAIPNRRPFADYDPYAAQQQQRTLQPRPPRSTDSPNPAVTNGEAAIVIRPVAPPEPIQEPQRKKRGRPSKEEAEERDRALALEGKVYQPKKRPVKKPRPSLETPQLTRSIDVAPPVVRTPVLQTLEVRDDSSSGRRRSKRQREDENQQNDRPDNRSDTSQPAAQSPSDRLLATHRERELAAVVSRDLPKSTGDLTVLTTESETRDKAKMREGA